MKGKITRPELLAPAGDMEALKAAVKFGADAVYFGYSSFSLRHGSCNFSKEEINNAILFCKSNKVKCYLAVNIFAKCQQLKEIEELFIFLKNTNQPDAIIVTDLSILSLARAILPKVDIHISTQANVTNYLTANEYHKLGAKRIILARELSLDDIKKISKSINPDLQLEVFIHGAMCMAISGRCLISDHLSFRAANRGKCQQPCRYKYKITEPKGESVLLEEEDNNSYILNSKDLSVMPMLKEILSANIASLKIEGRSKGAYYVANTVNAYRRAIDYFLQNKNALETPKQYILELEKSSHRKYYTGFFFEKENMQNQESSAIAQSYQFVAVVLEGENKQLRVEVRNKIFRNDSLELLSSTKNHNTKFTIKEILDENGNALEFANKVKQQVILKTDKKITAEKGDMLRKKL